MHGLGGSGQDYAYLFEPGGLLNFQNLKVLLPTAPLIPSLFSKDYYMRSWYEVASFKDLAKSVASWIYSLITNYDSDLGYYILFD